MRTATTETRRALMEAIEAAGVPYSTWARENGLPPVTVHDALHGKPMSARRENAIRAALGLSPLRFQVVELLDNQRVVTRSRPAANKRRAMSLPPDEAAKLDEEARQNGYRSTGAYALARLRQDRSLD